MTTPPSCNVGRPGDWMGTATGRQFWPLDPRADEIDIVDIAHALGNKCRYNGHTRRFYSVAEHSVLVSHHVPAAQALWGLLHDATEAYIPDVIRPLKVLPEFAFIRDIEARIARAICERFGLAWPEPATVKAVDQAIVADELAALLVNPWRYPHAPLGAEIRALAPDAAKVLFLRRFDELSGAAADHSTRPSGPRPLIGLGREAAPTGSEGGPP